MVKLGKCILSDADKGHILEIWSIYELFVTAFCILQGSQKGVIGIALNSNWFVPYSLRRQDSLAAVRALDFMFGWYGLC